MSTNPFHEVVIRYTKKDLMSEDEKFLFYGVTRRYGLLDQALGWWERLERSPLAGKKGPTAYTRGLMWRLCMAWASFETLMSGVSKSSSNCLRTELLEIWSSGINSIDPIPSPKTVKKLSAWIEEEGGDVVLEFLGTNRIDQKVLSDWILEQKSITDWVQAVILIEAIRNATVHGALSPTKAEELGLLPILERAPVILRDFAEHSLGLFLSKNPK